MGEVGTELEATVVPEFLKESIMNIETTYENVRTMYESIKGANVPYRQNK